MNAAFVRNTVAIQNGYDPSHAFIKFYWRTGKDGPYEIFERESGLDVASVRYPCRQYAAHLLQPR